MLGINDFGAFCVAILVFLALPGPGTFALLTSTAKGGFRAGAAATAGLIAGDQILLWLAVAGVAAMLAAHPKVFSAVQYLGAAYLAWIGLRLLFARRDSDASPVRILPRHYARQALLITLLNPKAIVFYMAFFPLFIDPARHLGLTHSPRWPQRSQSSPRRTASPFAFSPAQWLNGCEPTSGRPAGSSVWPGCCSSGSASA